MFPRRFLISRGAYPVLCLPGFVLIAILGGCASQQPSSEADAVSDNASEAPAAANASEPSPSSDSREGSSTGNDEGEAVADRAEAFANRVEERLQNKEGASPEDNAAGEASGSPEAQSEAVQWESQLRQSAPEPRSQPQSQPQPEPGQSRPPLRAAADQPFTPLDPSDAASPSGSAEASSGATDDTPQPAPTASEPGSSAPTDRAADDPPDGDTAPPSTDQTATEKGEAGTDPADLDRFSIDQLLDGLRRRLRNQADSEPEPTRPYLALGALSVLDPETAIEEEQLTGLDAETRRSLLAYQEAFAGLGRSFEEADDAGVRPMREAAEKLAEELRKNQPLRIRNAKLCKRVDGYGAYTPFPDQRFAAGREHPVIVYAELENFTPEKDEDGQYLVRLNQRIVLYNESDGLAVWRPSSSETKIVDRSRNRRRDFFVVQVIRLPARLTVGKYMLKLTITDEIGQSLDEATIPIRIVTDSEVASGAGN